MVADLHLIPEEACGIAHLLTRFRKMLDIWMSFVLEVETGYPVSVYEYADDLSARSIIAELIRLAPPEIQTKLARAVRPWDARFDEATRPSAKPVHGTRESVAEPWYYRIPKRMGDELADDLRSEGLIE